VSSALLLRVSAAAAAAAVSHGRLTAHGRSQPAAARAATGKCSAAARAAAPAAAEILVLEQNTISSSKVFLSSPIRSKKSYINYKFEKKKQLLLLFF